ncbi:MAG: hypothetical protein KDA65_00425 [Planctomycetaceae bacterium]|nr:hypothetical protein [Planctomycetaceae bacterium]
MNTNTPQYQPDVDLDQLLTGLARRARGETAPKVDVTAAVLHRLETEEEVEIFSFSDRVWWYSTAGSLVAAGIAMMIGYQSWFELTDPAFEMLQAVQVALR